MMTAPVITAGLNAVVLALTPVQRWQAARRFNTNVLGERWFILTVVVVLITLIGLLLVVSFKRMMRGRKTAERLFVKYAERRGLSGRERQILLDIAGITGLKESESVFTMGSSFDRGAAKIIEENLARKGAEESKQLRTELSFLREKLGFQKQPPAFIIGPLAKSKRLSSRQIPVGRKVHLTRRTTRISDDIEATVVENSGIELTVKLEMSVKITFGESWRVRYYFGASVWEFDTTMVSYDGDILVLNHSDNVRFINRRRFLRVPVKKPAFVAHFPFARTLGGNSDSAKEGFEIKRGSANASGSTWEPPEFVPAVVTELAGLGLRIEVPSFEVKMGDRVLVVLRLDEERDQDDKMVASKIIEDVGEVRHTKAIQSGLSIAVELTGCSDSDVNELIRATNAASVRVGAESQDIPGSVNAEGHVPEPETVQGV